MTDGRRIPLESARLLGQGLNAYLATGVASEGLKAVHFGPVMRASAFGLAGPRPPVSAPFNWVGCDETVTRPVIGAGGNAARRSMD